MEKGDRAFRSGELKGSWVEMTYGGVLSFCRRTYTRDLAGVDVAVSGVPFDSSVTYRPGCRLGPRAIRAASVQLAELKSFPLGFDPFETLAVADIGDCLLDPHHPLTVPETITDHCRRIVAAGATPLTLGGDHFISYPLLKAVSEKHGPVALLQFDAHCDTWPALQGATETALDHGTMFGRAVAEGVIDVARSVQVGIRTYNDSDHGFEILTAPWVHRHGIDATLEAIRARLGEGPVYISFDIDCLDPACAPGTGTPVPGGLASWQALELMRGLAGMSLIGMDVVEVSPPFDHAEITALAGAHLAYEFLCLKALEKGAVPHPTGRIR